jgi:hypothetical protein
MFILCSAVQRASRKLEALARGRRISDDSINYLQVGTDAGLALVCNDARSACRRLSARLHVGLLLVVQPFPPFMAAYVMTACNNLCDQEL